ncbi:MAG: hypothetical protein HY668_00615 [Chloroflexi bacterium]|nr:hypothetical protein [Chloroflexota bacterium]
MKKIIAAAVALMVLSLGISPVFAAKPQAVISISNGFPSGAHFNLNLHGKDPATFAADTSAAGGSSVFISLFGDSTLQLRSERGSAQAELTALDPYAEAFDGTPAVVQLPYEAEGYYVFARILGKPGNGKGGKASSIILTPNTIPTVENYLDPSNPDPFLVLGMVTTNGVYEMTSAGLQRFDSAATGGTGKSKAMDITGLFMWTGWVCDASLDINGDGLIDINDVPADQNGDGVIDQTDFDLWLAAQAALGLAVFYDNEWVFNIADVVTQEQTITNDGTRLLQVRFYPVVTTEFTR